MFRSAEVLQRSSCAQLLDSSITDSLLCGLEPPWPHVALGWWQHPEKPALISRGDFSWGAAAALAAWEMCGTRNAGRAASVWKSSIETGDGTKLSLEEFGLWAAASPARVR